MRIYWTMLCYNLNSSHILKILLKNPKTFIFLIIFQKKFKSQIKNTRIYNHFAGKGDLQDSGLKK